ncbi:hypothetical protein OGAPHI_004686 [Ogataea philodendri]|uniref:Uncharacterized protein n=1 Tax=Ogataea philodendri TaxID=1378263 RepID=A0A9P8P348_9ASCO|nr:uncharacterized protein OGAPHI_004686 [Ogataea philodendri]KAH3663972.1 hypothetical protein OGAPHI_004686 [Ogataea philodendri]
MALRANCGAPVNVFANLEFNWPRNENCKSADASDTPNVEPVDLKPYWIEVTRACSFDLTEEIMAIKRMVITLDVPYLSGTFTSESRITESFLRDEKTSKLPRTTTIPV